MNNIEPPWLTIARAEKGVEEHKPGDNPRILEYLRTVDLSELGELTDEISWCAAFVAWCLEQAGCKSTKSAAAKSYLHWGKLISEPRKGAIVILDRGTEPWMGHVGFVTNATLMHVFVLGGNQSNMVNETPYPLSRVRGYRWPKEYL